MKKNLVHSVNLRFNVVSKSESKEEFFESIQQNSLTTSCIEKL